MPVGYLLDSAQNWILHHGVTLALLFVIAVLVPRVGRFTKRVLSRRLENIDDQSNKSRLALIGAGVYIAQMVAYFILVVLALQEFGFSPTSAAIPATVISAALGLGAQSIIADFLAGFFIISEKQFGVGDWVQFIGSNMDLQGDVIQITMRATTIRTLSGETVIVPNSARVRQPLKLLGARRGGHPDSAVGFPIHPRGDRSVRKGNPAFPVRTRTARRHHGRPGRTPRCGHSNPHHGGHAVVGGHAFCGAGQPGSAVGSRARNPHRRA